MEKQIAVAYVVHAAVGEEHPDMLLELVAYLERMHKLLHQFGLLV